VNLADVEHAGAMITGGLLVVVGARRGGVLGTLLACAGGALVFRGQQGYRRLYDKLGIPLPQAPTGVGRVNERVEASVVIHRPAAELYRIWRNFENLPVFMDSLVRVTEIDDFRSSWVARTPLGTVVNWDAEIINDVEDRLIAWQTLEGSAVDMAGSVHFTPVQNGDTLVRVVFRYDPPADQAGLWISRALGFVPQTQLERDLSRFRDIMELGQDDPHRRDHAAA
jgi:uncharacterized membrane protein